MEISSRPSHFSGRPGLEQKAHLTEQEASWWTKPP